VEKVEYSVGHLAQTCLERGAITDEWFQLPRNFSRDMIWRRFRRAEQGLLRFAVCSDIAPRNTSIAERTRHARIDMCYAVPGIGPKIGNKGAFGSE
jgi:hypothetical protein